MLTPTDLAAIRAIVTEELARSRRRHRAPAADPLAAALDAHLDGRDETTVSALCAALLPDEPAPRAMGRIGKALAARGWARTRTMRDGARESRWTRPVPMPAA